MQSTSKHAKHSKKGGVLSPRVVKLTKLSSSLSLLVLLGGVASCGSSQSPSNEVVCATIHRYGIPLEPEEWSARGGHGQVISMRKDGVTIVRNYEGGLLHGQCTYSFPYAEEIQHIETYDQGHLKRDLFHYPNGFPQREVVYHSPLHQFVTVWYESGAPHIREEVENGRWIEGEYYRLDQQVESHVIKGNGLRTCRDAQGVLQFIDTVQEGQIVLRTTYHPNGMPAAHTPYVQGVIEGERRSYFSGGEPATIEMWRNNTQHGITHVFEQGEKRADIPYVHGQKHGIERCYRHNGKTVDDNTLAQEVSWVNGQKHGPVHHYIGDVKETDWYFHDRPVLNKPMFDMLDNP